MDESERKAMVRVFLEAINEQHERLQEYQIKLIVLEHELARVRGGAVTEEDD